MKFAIAIAVTLFGCSSQTSGSGLGDSCDRENACDEGVCSVTHTTDGSGECIAADEDIDSDGLTNENDFCNDGMGGQYDEDRDLIGDDCDKCPIAAPPANPDMDGDDVDSPCDPDPRTPGDKIVVFEGFRTGVPTNWNKTGTWTHAGGDVIGVPETPTGFATLSVALPLTTTKLAVLVQYRADSSDPAAPRSYAGLIARDLRPASNAVARCGSTRSSALGDGLSLETDAGQMFTPIINSFNSASLYSVALRVEGIQAGCAMIADATQVAATATTSGEALTEAGVFVQGSTVRFTYVLAIQRQ